MARVYKYNNQAEVITLRAILESNEIPVQIHSFEEWGYDGVFRTQMGMGEILVPDEFEEKAKRIIDEFLSSYGGG